MTEAASGQQLHPSGQPIVIHLGDYWLRVGESRWHAERDNPVGTRLFLIDDHSALREGLKILLEGRGDFQVVGESDNGEGALNDSRLASADVVLDGLQLLVRFKESFPHLRTVVFTVHQEESTVLAAASSNPPVKEAIRSSRPDSGSSAGRNRPARPRSGLV